MIINPAGGVPPERPANLDDLRRRFQPQPMVDWYAPPQLLSTGLKVVMSGVFGAYTDKREVQAALDPEGGQHFYDYSQEDSLWLDYMADTGDGFDSTYTMAWLVSRPQLTLDGPGKTRVELPRARVLVQGGDQVYPTPTQGEYLNRFEGPYQAAFPWGDERVAPHMFAVPGNHDWYDGLTAFMRLFCQRRWVGGWRTQQRRSYFALKLPHDWWLFAIDIQLDAELDAPQKEYFLAIVRNHMRTGAQPPRVILCTAEPSWVHCGVPAPSGPLVTMSGRPKPRRHTTPPEPQRFENLAFFENRILAANGVRQVITLSGNLHHYTRYAGYAETPEGSPTPVPMPAVEQAQRITAGGGGALLHATHHMADYVRLRERLASNVTVDRDYALAAEYPTEKISRLLSLNAFRLPLQNPSFGITLALLYLLFIWIMQSASKVSVVFSNRTGWTSLLEPDAAPSLLAQFRNSGVLMQHAPGPVFFVVAALLVLGALAYSQRQRWWMAAWGVLHGLGHVAVAIWIMWMLAPVVARVGGGSVDAPRAVFVFLVAGLLIGAIVGGTLSIAYLLLSSALFAAHDSEVFGVAPIPHYKNFLRMHIAKDITIYAIGVPKVSKWTVPKDNRSRPPTEPWLTPDGDAPKPVLIEPPVVVR